MDRQTHCVKLVTHSQSNMTRVRTCLRAENSAIQKQTINQSVWAVKSCASSQWWALTHSADKYKYPASGNSYILISFLTFCWEACKRAVKADHHQQSCSPWQRSREPSTGSPRPPCPSHLRSPSDWTQCRHPLTGTSRQRIQQTGAAR